MKRLIHWLRSWWMGWLWGRCPDCNSSDSKEVEGWVKRECRQCGKIWNY